MKNDGSDVQRFARSFLDPVRLQSCLALAQELRDRDDFGFARERVAEFAGASGPLLGASVTERAALDPAQPLPISIWQPRQVAGVWIFERPEPGPFGDHYADRLQFPLLKPEGRRRLCFFGESAAAGYLYAPDVTPAKVLGHWLAETESGWDVVDLARTNERLGSLWETFRRSLQLKPDVAVVYVGNNWNLLETPDHGPMVPEVEARLNYGAALAEQGLEGVLHRATAEVMRRARAVVAQISQAAFEHGMRLVWVVPEVNLADWEGLQPPPLLAGAELVGWYDAWRRAEAGLASEDWAGVREAALAMLALDKGLCPTPFRLLARSWMETGQLGHAREAAQAEVDSTHYASMCFLGSPRAGTVVRRVLAQAGSGRDALVDLAQVFAGSELPGRQWFLDYCHLTEEGMRRAMRAVAEAVLGAAVPGEGVGWSVTPAVHARAFLGAAIHTAHRECAVWGKHARLVFWLQRALEADPEIRQTLLDVVEARVSRLPAVLTAAQGRNRDSRFALQLQHGWRYDHVDAQLIAAIGEVLGPELTPLLCEAVGSSAVDLADPFWLWEPLHRFYPDVMAFDDLGQPAYHRSPWPVSAFALLAKGPGVASFCLTARVPLAALPVTCGLRVNGVAVGSVVVGARWTTVSGRLGGLVAGLNQVEVVWPVEAVAAWDPQTVVDGLVKGHERALHPVFGEIARFQVLLGEELDGNG